MEISVKKAPVYPAQDEPRRAGDDDDNEAADCFGRATALGCHPGLRHDAQGMYVAEREEVNVLCDPRVRTTIQAEHIELMSFRDLTPGTRPPSREAARF
jgi:predicted glycoside hydrolase/deacetylase ChbG (UPF0249 family)